MLLIMSALSPTLHTFAIFASRAFQTRRIVTCNDFDVLTEVAHVFISAVAFKLAKKINTGSFMLAGIRGTLVYIIVTSGKHEITHIS